VCVMLVGEQQGLLSRVDTTVLMVPPVYMFRGCSPIGETAAWCGCTHTFNVHIILGLRH